MAWGEHLYYHFFRDEVAAERKNHELLEWTPPWDLLWDASPEATRKEIAAIRYHFYGDDPSALFNRHASWSKAEYQRPRGQPWIKHSGLYAHAFMFLYSKTNDARWLQWSRGAGALYWNHRNPENNLTLGCIGDPRPSTQDASSQMPALAYWLHKAYRANPNETDFRAPRAGLHEGLQSLLLRSRHGRLSRQRRHGRSSQVQSEGDGLEHRLWRARYSSQRPHPGLLRARRERDRMPGHGAARG